MHPMDIVEAIDRLHERLGVVPGDDPMSIEAQKNYTLFFSMLLGSTFASKRVEENNGEAYNGSQIYDASKIAKLFCKDVVCLHGMSKKNTIIL